MMFLVFILSTVIYYISIRFFFDHLLQVKKLTRGNIVIVITYIIISNYLCLLYTATNKSLLLTFLLNYSITIILILILYQFKIKQIVILSFIYSILGMITESLVYLFLFNGKTIAMSYDFLVRLIVDITLLIFTKIWRVYFKRRKLTAKNEQYPIALLLFPISSIVVLHYLISLDGNDLTFRSLVEIFFIFVLNLFVFLLFDQTIEREAIYNEKLLYEEQVKYYEKHQIELEKHQLDLNMRNHDFTNHLVSISGYLIEENYDELKHYLKTISLFEDSVRITGCATIDALLYFYKQKFMAENIQFILDVAIPSSIPYEASDMSIILGNLLQNAFEEELLLEEATVKFVRLVLHFDLNKLVIIIENPFKTKLKKGIKNVLLSTKEEKRQKRGLGLKSIKKALAKYQHIFDIETKDDLFSVTIVLRTPEI